MIDEVPVSVAALGLARNWIGPGNDACQNVRWNAVVEFGNVATMASFGSGLRR